jgi:penicillin-binding protein 1A
LRGPFCPFQEHYGQGATAALPVWGYFMKLCYEDPALKVSKEPFERPSIYHKVDCYVPKKVVDTTAVEQDTEEFEL